MLLRSYLRPARFIIHTDHNVLKLLLASAEAKEGLARCGLHIVKVYCSRVYWAIIKHQAYYSFFMLAIDYAYQKRLDGVLPVLMIDET